MKKQLIFIGLLLLTVMPSVAQDTTTCNNLDEDARKTFYQAVQARDHDRKLAFELFRQILQQYPECGAALFHLAEMNYQLGMRSIGEAKPKKIRNNGYLKRASRQFHRLDTLCPDFEDYSTYFYLGMYYYDLNEYRKSGTYLEKFIDNSSSSYEAIKQSKATLEEVNYYRELLNNPVEYEPRKLEYVNSRADEYLPVISPDSKFLFFTRSGKALDEQQRRYFSYEKFMFSKYQKTDSGNFFAPPAMMPYPFNETSSQGGGSITIDNRTFYITSCSRVHTHISSYKNCDIFVSKFMNNEWTQLQNLGPAVNTKSSWEAQPSISSDGKTLYFASARRGGYGGIDIYYAEKDSSGEWCEARNMGPVINTPENDKTPFIHPDNKTLYFASDGHRSLGGFDMFISRKNEKTGEWGEPRNLGYPLNTTNDELAYVISTNGEKIYFATKNISDDANWNIYEAVLPQKARPDSVLLLTGSLYNEEGEPVEDASIEMQNIKTLKIIEGLVNKYSGDFAMATPVDKGDEFVVTARKEGYFFSSQYLKTSRNNIKESAEMNFVMKHVEIGTRIQLRNIYFDTNSAKFDEVSMVTLRNLLQFMRINPTIQIAIHGHTDNVGSKPDNLNLSRRRARAVHDFLTENGIAEERLSYKGLGEKKPIATNATRKGRAKNRRTEIVVTVK